MPKRFIRLKLDWQKFDELAAHHQSWPTWKKWVSISCLSIGIFLGPIAFYHNGLMSISRFGVTQSIALSDKPIILFAMIAIFDIILVFSPVVWVIALFFYEPFRSDS
jgi:hypothetical protein